MPMKPSIQLKYTVNLKVCHPVILLLLSVGLSEVKLTYLISVDTIAAA